MRSRLQPHALGAAASLAAAGLWIVLAARTPTSTHHFAPAVVGAAWGYVVRLSLEPRASQDRAISYLGGWCISLVTLGLLGATDRLLGPRLINALPVVPELMLSGLIGAASGSQIWTAFRSPRAAGS